MKYKLFISDYDGTLGVAPKNDIDIETLNAIKRFTELGGVFCVCSGREYSSIRNICLKTGLKGLLVSFQGARINDIETGELLFEGGLNEDLALLAYNSVKEFALEPVVYTQDGFYISKDTSVTAVYEKAVNIKGKLSDPEEAIKRYKRVCKLGWLGDAEVVNTACEELNKKFNGKGLKFNSGAKGLLEAINPECSKGHAVRFLANHYNVPLSQVLTVGDSTNDIDLVKGEWQGVAVGDAREELKAVAKEITVPFSKKPIKHLLEKYCLDN